MVKGQVSHELEVGVAAEILWKTYGTLELGNLVVKLLPNVVQKAELVEGDGGIGTVLAVTFSPDVPGVGTYKEKFINIDNEKRIKVVDVVEGGYLDLGFLLYRVRFEVVEKGPDASIIKSAVEYEVAEESAANVSMVTTKPLEVIAEVIGKYLVEKKANATT